MGLPQDQIAATMEDIVENMKKSTIHTAGTANTAAGLCHACNIIAFSSLNWHSLDSPLEMDLDDA
jgi:hypothetical protein